MVKQKQQVISRFFAPKTPNPVLPNSTVKPFIFFFSSTANPPPNVKTTVSFSPSKRKLLSTHLASTPKRPKATLSPHTHNHVPPQSNPSLHQKFLQKLLEPFPPSLLEPSVEPVEPEHKKYTTLEQQVVGLKNKYPDVLLMVEVGYRFRFFGKDAKIAAKVLGIYAHMDRNFLTASVPTFRSCHKMASEICHPLMGVILRNNSDGSESGSLLGIMNHPLTIYGSRLFNHGKHDICSLDAVSEIALSMGSYKRFQSIVEIHAEDYDVTRIQREFSCVLSSVLTYLGRSPDIQRGITRIFHRIATPAEVSSPSLSLLLVIQAILSAGKQLRQLHIVKEYEDYGSKKVSCDCAVCSVEKVDFDCFIFQYPTGLTGYLQVARARKAVQLAKEKLDNLIGLYRKQFGINMCVRNHTFDRASMQLPIDAKVPSNWVKINSTKKTIRYHPPEVLTALDQLRLANEELTASVELHRTAFLNYVRPIFVDDNEPVQTQIHSRRHPVS
ncbi:hypothetical protein CRYUN_Cryun19dG0078600 [Craigia yunnanensis]